MLLSMFRQPTSIVGQIGNNWQTAKSNVYFFRVYQAISIKTFIAAAVTKGVETKI